MPRRPRQEQAAEPLERWLAPTLASQVDHVDVAGIVESWTPERVGELPLAASVALLRAVGVVDPVLLRPLPGGRYEAVTGHRTVAAARLAGVERIPAVVREMDDARALMALALDGSATGRITAAGASELQRKLRAAGLSDERVIEELLATIVVAPAEEIPAPPEPEPAPEPEPVPEPVEAAAAAPAPLPEPAASLPAAPEAGPVPEPVAAAAAPDAVPASPRANGDAPRETLEPAAVAGASPVAEVPEPPAPAPSPLPVPVPEPEPQAAQWLPLPAGAPRLGKLSSAFADTPRLLRLLAGDAFTGTVELAGGDGREEALTFLDGGCLAVTVTASGRRVDAPLRLPSPDDGPVVEITVRPHPAPVAVALALALRSPARLVGLHASFLHLPGLLATLEREEVDAACVVHAPAGEGVILLAAGTPVAAYARRAGEGPGETAETTDVEAVAGLLAGGEGTVDVHVGPLPPALDLEELIARSTRGS